MYWKDEIYFEDDQRKNAQRNGRKQYIPIFEEMLCVSMTTRHTHTLS